MDNLLPRGHRPGRARPGRQARRPVFPALCWTGSEKCREARGGPGTWSLNKRRLYNRRFGMSGTSPVAPVADRQQLLLGVTWRCSPGQLTTGEPGAVST